MSILGVDNSAVDYILTSGGTSMDTLSAGTMIWWLYPANVTNSLRNVAGKSVDGATRIGWELFRKGTSGSTLRFLRYRATTNIDFSTNASHLAATTWCCTAMTFDTAAVGNCKFYKGRLTSALTDDTAAGGSAGTGSVNDDSAYGLNLLGNITNTGTHSLGFPGRLAFFGVWNRVLSLTEMVAQQWRPTPTSGCVGMFFPGLNGASTCPDYSGNGNTGTVTGCSLAAHVPVLSPFAWHHHDNEIYAVAAATAKVRGFPRGMFHGMRRRLDYGAVA